jgi:hypothetical protein
MATLNIGPGTLFQLRLANQNIASVMHTLSNVPNAPSVRQAVNKLLDAATYIDIAINDYLTESPS